MQLPQSLAPWGAYLNLLAAPLPFSLGPTIKCLELVFGPSRAALNIESDDEPEGYDGIARKGTYERLVLSEWLLADEYPDEFLRRSSVGEHAFLELTRKSPSGKKKTTVLFDCGPNQLGSPRIAHLAILIVLARRSELNGMEVEWGVLQDAQCTLFSGAGKESIEKLISSRTVHEVTDRDIARWFEATADKSVVIAGGARLSKLLRRRQATLLTIEDVLEPEENALSASYVASTSNRKSEFILPLPPEHDCVQILQNPFEVANRERQQEKQPVKDWSLVASGEFFLLRHSQTSVISVRVPNSARSKGIRQRTYMLRSDAAVIASGANVADSAVVMLTISAQNKHEIVSIGGKDLPGYFTHHLAARTDFEHRSKNRYLNAIFPSPEVGEFVWVLVGDKILQIPTRSGQVLSSVIAEDVFWLASSRGTIGGTTQDVLVYARLNNGRYQVVIVGLQTGSQESFIIPGRPLFCSPSEILITYRDARLGLWNFANYPPSNAVADPIHDRQFLHDETPIEMVTATPHGSGTATSLILLSKDSRDLHIVSSGAPSRLRLPQASSAIRSVAVNKTGVIAYITERAELTIVWPNSKWQRLVFDGHRFQGQWRDVDDE